MTDDDNKVWIINLKLAAPWVFLTMEVSRCFSSVTCASNMIAPGNWVKFSDSFVGVDFFTDQYPGVDFLSFFVKCKFANTFFYLANAMSWRILIVFDRSHFSVYFVQLLCLCVTCPMSFCSLLLRVLSSATSAFSLSFSSFTCNFQPSRFQPQLDLKLQ